MIHFKLPTTKKFLGKAKWESTRKSFRNCATKSLRSKISFYSRPPSWDWANRMQISLSNSNYLGTISVQSRGSAITVLLIVSLVKSVESYLLHQFECLIWSHLNWCSLHRDFTISAISSTRHSKTCWQYPWWRNSRMLCRSTWVASRPWWRANIDRYTSSSSSWTLWAPNLRKSLVRNI